MSGLREEDLKAMEAFPGTTGVFYVRKETLNKMFGVRYGWTYTEDVTTPAYQQELDDVPMSICDSVFHRANSIAMNNGTRIKTLENGDN
jgi:hypothetical protein